MSGPAKDFLESLYKDNPQIKTEKFDLGEIRRMMAAHQEKQNNTGLDDSDGLSPSQMDSLLIYDMQLYFDKVKTKLRRVIYSHVLSNFGFGNRVSRSIWEKQFDDGFWDYLYGEQEQEHYRYISTCSVSWEKRILDIGCGQGVLYSYLTKEIASVDYLGIDIASKAIELAKRKFPGARFRQLDFQYRNLNEKFDLIIFNETLYYFNQPLKTIEKCIKQNLNPHGVLIISMCDFRGHDKIWEKLRSHYHFLSFKEITNEKKQRWKVAEIKPYNASSGIG